MEYRMRFGSMEEKRWRRGFGWCVEGFGKGKSGQENGGRG